MNHDLTTEEGRVEAAKEAGRNVAQHEVKEGHTEPRNWDKDNVRNARAFSHLAAVGFTRIGCRMYSITFVDEYRRAFYKARLEALRAALRAENISYGELVELQNLVAYIESGDVELLEAAGVPEFPED